MKQVEQNYRSGELRVSEVPAPKPGAGQICVATRVSLISSGTERQLIDLAKASLAGKAMARPDLVRRVVRNVQRDGLMPTIAKVLSKLDTPIPLGYSLAGVVLETGRNAGGLQAGDRVACAGAGFANHAEFNVVPKNLTVRIPDSVSFEDASFATLGAIALQGLRLSTPTIGERFVVMGLGLIGLITVQLLKANGCHVLGYDPNPARTALALQMGADLAVSEGLAECAQGFSGGYGADAVVLTASAKSSEPLNVAAEISRLKGRIVVVGMVGMTLDREPFYKRELDLRMSMSYGPGRHDPSYELSGNDYPLAYVRWTERRNLEAFLDLIAAGKVTPQTLITHRFAIADAEQAYGVMEKGEPHLAMLLTYHEQQAAPLREIAKAKPQIAPGSTRIGFIGLGNYAKALLLPAIKKDKSATLVRVATSTGISAGHAGEKHGFATVATDPDTVINADDTDTVFVATRHDTHARYTAAALHSGKHVFCEKPLAMDEVGLQEILGAESSTGAILTVGFNRRFAPLLINAKVALSPRSGPIAMLYRINAGAIPGDSWIQREEGGGRIVGEVCHFIDAMTYLSGSIPVEVSAVTARGHDDVVSILLKFADGSTGTIVYTALGHASVAKEYLEVFAAGCVIQLDDFVQLTISKGAKSKVEKSSQDKGQTALVAAFLDAVRNGKDAPIPVRELAAVTRATFAVEEALQTGAVVEIAGHDSLDA